MTRIRITLAAAVATAATLAFAAPALAVERFASTAGIASGACDTEAIACTLEFAVESAAVDGDVVTVLPGAYPATTSLDVSDAILVRGAPGQARPVLNSTSTGGGIGVSNAGATLRRFEIVHNATGATAALNLSAGIVEQVIVRSNGADTNTAACRVISFTTIPVIRDTLCLQNVTGTAIEFNPGAGTQTATARNLTAIAAGDDAFFANVGPGESVTVNATNVIARGLGTDVEAQLSGGVAVTINLDHSNYAVENQFAGTTITDPGSGTNQTAAPQFVNAAGGDFRQTAGSPTRNAGIGGAGLGTGDFEGELRTLGTAPDIGADEFTEAAPDADGDGVPDVSDTCPSQAGPASNNGCPLPVDTGGGGGSGDGGGSGGDGGGGGGGATPDTDDPETEITKSPKKELKAGDTAKVSFESDEDGATFECKVGKKGKFKACTSPLRIRDLEKGKTKVQIRAIDPAGNVDETPAKLTIEAGGGKGK